MSCTDLYPSNIIEWQPVECVLNILDIYHGCIGEELYKGRSKGSLAENGIFFFDHYYVPPKKKGDFGTLTKLALPDFKSGEWPLPSASTSESFRCKLFNEVQKCLKPNIASKQSRICLFMPITVFIDFFANAEVRISRTMFSVKVLDSESVLEFVDNGWNTKTVNGITCSVQENSIACKYMIHSQNFIMTFYYRRWHYVSGQLTPLDQDMEDFILNPIQDIDVWYNNDHLSIVKIRGMCTLQQLRLDLQNEEIEMPPTFYFQVNGRKVIKIFHPFYFTLVFI